MARVAKLLKNIFDLQNIGAAVKGMDKASTEIMKQLINTIPDMKRYVSDKNE